MSHVLQAAMMFVLIVGTAATGILAILTGSWAPMVVGYPATLVGTLVLAYLTIRAIDREVE